MSRLSDTDIAALLDHLGVRQPHRDVLLSWGATASVQARLDALTSLQRRFLVAVPFDDLDLHYSATRTVSLDVQHSLRKCLEKRRGGYCMQNNALFRAVLLGLGVDVYSTGARVNAVFEPGNQDLAEDQWLYHGFDHMVNLVRLGDGQVYLVDVGIGTSSTTAPMPLATAASGPTTMLNIAPAAHLRLRLGTTSQHADPARAKPIQLLESSLHAAGEAHRAKWRPVFCFDADTEFLEPDFEMMSFFTSTHPMPWFRRDPVCSRLILDSEGAPIGHATLFKDRWSVRHGADIKEQGQVQTEEERCRVLEDKLGIVLTAEEKVAIRQYPSALKYDE